MELTHQLKQSQYRSTTMFVRSENVVLRKEVFGGVAFHKKIGTTIELDNKDIPVN